MIIKSHSYGGILMYGKINNEHYVVMGRDTYECTKKIEKKVTSRLLECLLKTKDINCS